YNPYVVYGTWWWPAFRPVYWRPWHARPVYVTRVVQPVRIVQPARIYSRPVQVTPYHRIPESQRAPIIHSGPLPQSSTQWNYQRAPVARPPVSRSVPMPAPQVRFNEPRFNRGNQAAAGNGVRSGGGIRGGGHHRG